MALVVDVGRRNGQAAANQRSAHAAADLVTRSGPAAVNRVGSGQVDGEVVVPGNDQAAAVDLVVAPADDRKFN